MKKLFQLLRDNATDKVTLRAENVGTVATLYIYDVIDRDFGISSLDVAKFIASLSADVHLKVRINSPGGDVFEGKAIATAIRNHPGQKTTYIDGISASAATTVAIAGDTIQISDGAFFMIHNAWTFSMGDKNALLETAALLDKVDSTINAEYVKKTGLDEARIREMMDAETWLTAQEAVEMGFCDSLQESTQTNVKQWSLSAYEKAPKTQKPNQENLEALRANNQRRLQLLNRI